MSFYEDLATALDVEGIEARVLDDTLFVPITPDLEIQFVEIDPHLPAANVYIAGASEQGVEFDAALVAVVFSVEDAVAQVSRHITTDQVVTLIRDLLDGSDPRLEGLEFEQHSDMPQLLVAPLDEDLELRVHIEPEEDGPVATVDFVLLREEDEDVDDDPFAPAEERLELGSFTDFDRLFQALGLAVQQAESWASQLVNFDDDFEDFDVVDDEDDEFEDDFDEDLDQPDQD